MLNIHRMYRLYRQWTALELDEREILDMPFDAQREARQAAYNAQFQRYVTEYRQTIEADTPSAPLPVLGGFRVAYDDNGELVVSSIPDEPKL